MRVDFFEIYFSDIAVGEAVFTIFAKLTVEEIEGGVVIFCVICLYPFSEEVRAW